VADGLVPAEDVMPAILVSAQPHYEESQPWFAVRAIEVLQRSFGRDGLRLCEACMAPRAYVEGGSLTWQTGPVGLDEIVRLDDQTRGEARPARSAIWLDEHRGGVAIRIVDLHTGGVLFAQNVDPSLVESANTERMYTLSEELERRARGDSLTQAFVDFGLYPGQHVSLDWTDQWGSTNANLTGVTISLLDPILGLGVCHYRRLPLANLLIGAKGIVSLPTVIARSQGSEGDILDPTLTGVAVVRVPFGRSNYGALATVSTNGAVGLGLSLLNIHFLPVLP
jgi:hypothetical protein